MILIQTGTGPDWFDRTSFVNPPWIHSPSIPSLSLLPLACHPHQSQEPTHRRQRPQAGKRRRGGGRRNHGADLLWRFGRVIRSVGSCFPGGRRCHGGRLLYPSPRCFCFPRDAALATTKQRAPRSQRPQGRDPPGKQEQPFRGHDGGRCRVAVPRPRGG